MGIAAAKLGAVVTATDLEPNCALLRRNVASNDVNVEVKAHRWGESPAALSPPFDVIIACGATRVAYYGGLRHALLLECIPSDIFGSFDDGSSCSPPQP